MKILYYFLNLDSMMYQWQKYHIVDELATHGFDVEIFSPLDVQSVDEANDVLLDKIRTGQYSLFMTCLTEKHLYVDTLIDIKNLGVPTLLFCPDNLVAPFNHQTIARHFDLVWLTSKETEYLFKRWGCNTVFLPYAANPYFLKPVHHAEEILRVGFIGTPHGSRVARINDLLAGGIPVTIHTNSGNLDTKFMKASVKDYADKLYHYLKYPIGWKLASAAFIDKLWHKELVDEFSALEKKDAVPLQCLSYVNNQYALVLSFTDADSTGVLPKPVPIVNLRNFEIPMCGGIQFTTYTDEIASYFEDNKEILLCRSKEEYVDKAKFYLKPENAQLRQNIRVAARKRAEGEHTWHHRFKAIFYELDIRA